MSGAFVEGIAGAFVEAMSGVFVDGIVDDVSSDFWQPVNNPAQSSPAIATNVSSFFIRVHFDWILVCGKDFLRCLRKILRRQLVCLPDQIQILRQISEMKRWQTTLFPAKQFARPAQFQIRLGDFEAVRGFLENF
jgi:hypothetical protein